MIDFMLMCSLVMFLFMLFIGLIFWLVTSSSDLFGVSLAGVLTCWAFLCLRRD